MTSYQSRLRDEKPYASILDAIAMIILILALIGMTMAYIGAKTRHEKDRANLLSCQEHLSDLEESGSF